MEDFFYSDPYNLCSHRGGGVKQTNKTLLCNCYVIKNENLDSLIKIKDKVKKRRKYLASFYLILWFLSLPQMVTRVPLF